MMGRLARVLVAEGGKVARRKIGYVALGLALAASAASVLLAGVQRQVIELGGGKAASTLNGFELFASALQNGVMAGSIPLLVLAGLTMAEERELGTAKIIFSKAIRRADLVVAKGLVLLGLVGAVVLVSAGFSWALVAFTHGFTDVQLFTIDPRFPTVMHEASRMTRYAVTATALTLPPLAAIALFGLLLSSLARQTGVAVGACFGAVVVLFAVGTFVDHLKPWLVTFWLTYPTDVLGELARGISRRAFDHPKELPVLVHGLTTAAASGLAVWALACGVTMRQQIVGALLGAALAAGILAAPAPALAQGALPFRIAQHRVEGQVEGMRITDMDGDGRSDMVVFYTNGARGPTPQRFLALFFQDADGRFSQSPDQVLPVPGDAVARVIANLDPKHPGQEIAWITPEGVRVLTPKGRVYPAAGRVVIQEPSLFDMASGADLPSWDSGAQDIDGDGRDDLLLLRKGDAVLYLQRPDGTFEKRATFPLGYKQRFGPRIESILLRRFLSFNAELSRPVLVDCNGDGKLDLVTMRDKALEVYLQRDGGRFAPDPDRRAPLGLLVQEGDEDEINQVNADLVDVSGNGQADLLLFRNVGQVGVFESLRTQVIYCKAGPEGWSTERPTQVINLFGISMSPALIDIDGDGARDLVLSSLRTDMISNLATALFESVTITYYVFLFDKAEGKFSATADFARDLKVDVKRIDGGGTVPLAYFWGDFDGDGMRDLVTLDKEDQVSIFPARIKKGGMFSADSLDFPLGGRVDLQLATSNANQIQDINWDGRHDLVFWYGGTNAGENGLITVVMSRKP